MRERVDEVVLEEIVLVSSLVLPVRPCCGKHRDADEDEQEDERIDDYERHEVSRERLCGDDALDEISVSAGLIDPDASEGQPAFVIECAGVCAGTFSQLAARIYIFHRILHEDITLGIKIFVRPYRYSV